MRQTQAIHPAPTLDDAQFQFALALACMLALAIALVYFFPDRNGAEQWRPEAVLVAPGM